MNFIDLLGGRTSVLSVAVVHVGVRISIMMYLFGFLGLWNTLPVLEAQMKWLIFAFFWIIHIPRLV